MNQILSTEVPKDNSKYKNNNQIDIKKIIIFFACSIVVFGICISGIGIYKLINNNKQSNTGKGPVVTAEQLDNSVSVLVEYDKGISKVSYYWNNGDREEEVLDGNTFYEKLVDIPSGTSILNIDVEDMEGNVTTKTFNNFVSNEIQTSIEIAPIENGDKIKIAAQNQNGLQYVKYKLNDNDEVKIDSDLQNPNIIEITVDIDNLNINRGENKIVVTAVDKNGNEKIEEQKIKGRNEPVIKVIRNNNKLECEISHDMGLEKIEFEFNGRNFTYDKNSSVYDETSTTFKTTITLEQGENTLIINAYSKEGTTRTYRGKATI